MFIQSNIHYKLHWYYDGVQDTTLENNTRAIFINNLLASYGDVN